MVAIRECNRIRNTNIEIEEIQEFRDLGILELLNKFIAIPKLIFL